MEGSAPPLTVQVLQQQGDGCRPPLTQRRVDVPVQDVQEAQRGRPAAVPLVGAGGHGLREAEEGARSTGTAPPRAGAGMEATSAPGREAAAFPRHDRARMGTTAPRGESPPLAGRRLSGEVDAERGATLLTRSRVAMA